MKQFSEPVHCTKHGCSILRPDIFFVVYGFFPRFSALVGIRKKKKKEKEFGCFFYGVT
jgi:hypothetical protein